MASESAPPEPRVAIVTGGACGIGFEIAARLARDGRPSIALFDREEEALATAQQRLRDNGVEVDPHVVDVTSEAVVRGAVEAVVARHGRIDVLVNNAGIYPHIPFEDLTLSDWKRIISANLDGTFLCAHAVFPHMRERGYGRIVNVSSNTFFNGYPGLTAYVASKGGVIGFTRTLASEAAAHGITVNAVAPGLIASEYALRNLGPLFDQVVNDQQIIKRRGEPADVAEAVAYLVSSAAGFVTGQTLNVDGGTRFH